MMILTWDNKTFNLQVNQKECKIETQDKKEGYHFTWERLANTITKKVCITYVDCDTQSLIQESIHFRIVPAISDLTNPCIAVIETSTNATYHVDIRDFLTDLLNLNTLNKKGLNLNDCSSVQLAINKLLASAELSYLRGVHLLHGKFLIKNTSEKTIGVGEMLITSEKTFKALSEVDLESHDRITLAFDNYQLIIKPLFVSHSEKDIALYTFDTLLEASNKVLSPKTQGDLLMFDFFDSDTKKLIYKHFNIVSATMTTNFESAMFDF